MAEALDVAVLFGTGAPAGFPTGGIKTAAGAAATGADAPAAVDAAAAAVEAAGGVVNGIAASTRIGTAMRQAYLAANALPDQAPGNTLYGWPVVVTADWDDTAGDALVGDWNYLLVGVREDITFDLSEDAILQDAAGEIIANAFQEDLTAMRCYMRVGVALGSPISTVTEAAALPFEFADWTA